MSETSSHEGIGEFRDQSEEEPRGYEYFDPEEELEKLKTELYSMPKEERILCYSEKFDLLSIAIARQRMGIAGISAQVEAQYVALTKTDSTDRNPEMSGRANKEELMAIVNDNAVPAKLSPRQIAVFEHQIDKVLEADKQIDDMEAEFTVSFEDEELAFRQLVNNFYHFLPDYEVGIERGPASIIFVIDKRDWPGLLKRIAEVYGTEYNPNAIGIVAADLAQKDHLFAVGARKNYGASFEKITYPIPESVSFHEQRHALDYTLSQLAVTVPKIREILRQSLGGESSEEDVKLSLESVQDMVRHRLLRSVKSEILAYLEQTEFISTNLSSMKSFILGLVRSLFRILPHDKTRKRGELLGTILEKKSADRNRQMLELWQEKMNNPNDSGSYNYRADIFEMAYGTIREIVDVDDSVLEKLVEDWSEEIYQLILSDIDKGIDAAIDINQLCGMGNQEIIWLLQNDPIEHWPALAERIKILKSHPGKQPANPNQ